MATLVESLTPLLDAEVVGRMSQKLGVDEQTARRGVEVALPLLVSALARNSASPEGAQALSNALARDHDGSVLQRVPNAVDNYQAGPGDGILRHVLGEQRANVETTLTQTTGVNASALLQMLAPVVLGAVGNMAQKQQLDAGGLATTLQSEQQQMSHSRPDMMGMLSTVLDTNKDGSPLDDVIGLAGKLFSRRS
jgi:hypothetical protein